jgi:hypothetical protein
MSDERHDRSGVVERSRDAGLDWNGLRPWYPRLAQHPRNLRERPDSGSRRIEEAAAVEVIAHDA